MLRSWAEALHIHWVRGLLVACGLLVTFTLGPMSMFGAYILVVTFLSDTPDRFHFLGWSVVGTGGLIGIAGAWMLLLIPRRMRQENPLLKWVTAVALLIGVGVAASVLAGTVSDPENPVVWLMAPALIIGVFLLGATLGEGHSN